MLGETTQCLLRTSCLLSWFLGDPLFGVIYKTRNQSRTRSTAMFRFILIPGIHPLSHTFALAVQNGGKGVNDDSQRSAGRVGLVYFYRTGVQLSPVGFLELLKAGVRYVHHVTVVGVMVNVILVVLFGAVEFLQRTDFSYRGPAELL